ncbi:MAG: hypothetical protein RJA07_1019 [Bacteroidota bacterium]|jgi:hypothetical protein
MTNQLTVKMTLDAWNAQVNNANKLLNELSDEQLQNEVAPNRNRGVYLLGHLTAVNDKMLPLLGLGEQSFAHLNEPFLSKADKTVAEIPTASELRNSWHESTATLTKHFNALSTDDFFAKHTSVSAEDFAKEPHRNRLNVINSRTNHLAYHLGQLSFLKK